MSTEHVVAFVWRHYTLHEDECDSLWDAVLTCQGARENGTGAPDRIEIDGRTVLTGDQVDDLTEADLPEVRSGAFYARHLRKVADREAAEQQAEAAFQRQLEGNAGWIPCPVGGCGHRIVLTMADMETAFVRGRDSAIDTSGAPSLAQHFADAHPDLTWQARPEVKLRADGYVPFAEWRT